MPHPLLPLDPDEPTLVVTNWSGFHTAPIQFWLVQFGRRQELTRAIDIDHHMNAGRIVRDEDYAPALLELFPIVEQRTVLSRFVVAEGFGIAIARANMLKRAEQHAKGYGLRLAEWSFEERELPDTDQTEITLTAYAR